MIKLLKKGIKIDGQYFPCWYSSSRSNINGNATIYFKNYCSLPQSINEIFNVENDTDIMIDYFEKSRIRVPSSHPLFSQVEALSKN